MSSTIMTSLSCSSRMCKFSFNFQILYSAIYTNISPFRLSTVSETNHNEGTKSKNSKKAAKKVQKKKKIDQCSPIERYYRETYDIFGSLQNNSHNKKKQNNKSVSAEKVIEDPVVESVSEIIRTEAGCKTLEDQPFLFDSLNHGHVWHSQKSFLSSRDQTEEYNSSKHSMINLTRVPSLTLPSLMQIPRKSQARNPSDSRSISTILNETMSEKSRLILLKWKQNMIIKLGVEGFQAYQEEIFRRGRTLHTSIEEVLRGKGIDEVVVDHANSGHWQSLTTMLEHFHDVAVIESFVKHPDLNYYGVLDCVALYKNTLVLIEWKTSERKKPRLADTYDNPLQAVAYLGAINHDENYEILVENAAIVVAYDDGSPGHLHFMDSASCLFYWRKWLDRLRLFNKTIKKKETSKSEKS